MNERWQGHVDGVATNAFLLYVFSLVLIDKKMQSAVLFLHIPSPLRR
jgi:hypothetical protein